ncbi:MAG: nucleotide-binding universal stress UspA family protein [Candidatus Aldehydirespiratoraceae bacterium]|jgi:nucleotide-binding universal stress UspA family protein
MSGRQIIVVGDDGSANARAAVAMAAELVEEGGVVHVVTSYRLPSAAETDRMWAEVPTEFRGSYDVLATPSQYQADALAFLKGEGVDGQGHLVEGDPATAILSVAEDNDADIVVVGSRGLGRAAGFLRGSVSTRVASHAATNVLIVHDDE